jgi:O-antigen biosynthesis protein
MTSGSGEYRMTGPFRALQKAGLAQTCVVHPIGNRIGRVLNAIELARAAPDTLMMQQAIDDTQMARMRQYQRYNKDIFVTYAVDDVMGNLPRKHYLYNYHAREGKSRVREGLSLSNRLIASTEPIADFCRGMIDDIVVVPNRLERDKWCGLTSKRRVGKKPRVGWAGAQQHLGDLELIKEVVATLADEVEWVFMGMCPDFLKRHILEEHSFVPFNDYPAKLASLNLDLAIAPLEQHLFNEGKSNLRLLEYGIMGWPVVCTDVYPYQTNNAPVKRVQNQAVDWVEAIRERIYDLDAAEKEGDNLRNWVLKHYILEDHIDDWLRAITPK